MMNKVCVLEWSLTELQDAFMPVYTKVFNTQPESGPFVQPVNPEFLGIPVCMDSFYVWCFYIEFLMVSS